MNWFGRIASAVEAAAACITAMVAVAAMIGVKVQLDAADQIQKATTARDAYRGNLALAVAHPDLAAPKSCAVLRSDQTISYTSFVDHLLYSAELMLDMETGWDNMFLDQFAPHAPYLCSNDAPAGDTVEVTRLLAHFRANRCAATTACN